MTRRWNGRPWLLAMTAFAVLVLGTSAFAQGAVRGVVRDEAGEPVSDVVVTIQSEARGQKFEQETNSRGEFLQIGLSPGPWVVTASKDSRQSAASPVNVSPSRPAVAELVLAGPAGPAAEVKQFFDEAVAASNAKRFDEAIDKFNQALKIHPQCFECYNNIGFIHTQRKEFDRAEAAFKQAAAIQPNDAVAYTGLANIYNAQRKFDLAAEASAKAAQLAGGGGGAGGDANALYHQGVILWDGGRVAEARAAFQKAIGADPNHADAHYQLGMTLLNEGDIADAVTEFETYLKLAPSGEYAAVAQTLLVQIKP